MNAREAGAFGARLRSLRTTRGLTQQALADRSGVSSRSISDLERGINQRPHRDTAIRLADVLQLGNADRLAFLELARPLPRAANARSPTASRPAWPPRLSPLQGREKELRTIERALLGDGVQLLTLTGPGGVGKTRLATEVARRQAIRDRFREGIVFVRLDGLQDHRLVLPAIAAELQLLDTAGERPLGERIGAYLADRKLLLILDNFEHLQQAATDLSSLLGQGSTSRFLVTSRDALRIRGEHVLAVSPLPRPNPAIWKNPQRLEDDGGSAAIAIYVQRARLARPDVAIQPTSDLGRSNLAVIAETCHRLDGLPLAIELAAAQAVTLSAAQILEQLKTAGLSLLVDDARDLPARHQTMNAAIAWSYDRLSATERAAFRTLAVFAGGFSLPAASAILGAIPDASHQNCEGGQSQIEFDPIRLRAGSPDSRGSLIDQAGNRLDRLDPSVVQTVMSLARQSLLCEDTTTDGVGPRFRMLEPVRLFALERLRAAGEEAGARLRHAEYFARMAAVLDTLAFGAEPQIWLERQLADLDNVRVAQDWLLAAGEADLAVLLTSAIAQLWLIKGPLPEARQRVAAAIAVDGTSPPARRWFLRFWAGTFAFEMGDLTGAAAYARELLAMAELHDDRVGIGVGLTLLSRVEGARASDQTAAIQLARQAVETLGPQTRGEWLAWAWSRLGVEYHHAGRLDDAWRCHATSLEIRRRGSSEGCTTYSLVLLGAACLDKAEPLPARSFFREGLALTVKHDNPPLMLAVLLGLADLAWRFASNSRARQSALEFFGAAEAIRSRHGLPESVAVRDVVSSWQSRLSSEVGVEAVEALPRAGARLTQEEVIALASSLNVSAPLADRASGHRPLSLLSAMGSIE